MNVRRETAATALLLAAALHGCASCDTPPDDALTSCEMGAVIPGAVKTDILFVVDDSGSMDAEQINLRDNLVTFVTALADSPVANDIQIGVTTTSVTDFAGNPTGEQGCFVGPWLSGGSASLLPDFQAQIDSVGIGGSGKEQPFRAMELALTTPALAGCTNNTGFLRPGSRLAVIFLSDEDDCSDSGPTRGITQTGTTTGNDQCHNDYGDGVDYKFTRIDSIDRYAAFLAGPIGGEVRQVVLASIVGVDAVTLAPTCGNTGNSWCCGGTAATTGTCTANACASFTLSVPASPPSLTGDAYCCGGVAGTACASPCATAYDKADRFAALLARFPVNRRLAASVCDSSFATSLQRIAGLIISPTVPLEGAPADARMLVVGVRKPDGSRLSCTVAAEGSAEALTADAVYAPPAAGAPATLTFRDGGGCTLEQGFEIEIDVICAG